MKDKERRERDGEIHTLCLVLHCSPAVVPALHSVSSDVCPERP